MRKPLYGIGDKVKIINYGHLIWEHKDIPENQKSKRPTYYEEYFMRFIDINPELINQKGLIQEVSNTQNTPKYSISGIKGKTSWYSEDQMKMIKQNPNNIKT